MRRHHISNGALAAIICVAVVLMWLVNRPNTHNIPERPLFRGHHVAGSVTDNVLLSDFQGMASQTGPIMPSRALGIFHLTSERADQSMICVQGGKPAQSALLKELSGSSGVLAVNVTLRFELLHAALKAGNVDEARYQAERLEQAYTLLRLSNQEFDQPLKGWEALHNAINSGDLTQATAQFGQVFKECLACQGPDGERFLKAYPTSN